jgi:WD40 repeat protein
VACHNETTTKGGLNLETPALIRQGGDSGPGLVPGEGKTSLVVTASQHLGDLEMPPPNNKSGAVDLSASEIAKLIAWIDQGARDSTKAERTVVWQSLPRGLQPIHAVTLTRDGRFAACARSHRIQLYDLAAGQPAGELADPALGSAHRAPIHALAFSPDGTRLASGSFREVHLWRLAPPDPVPDHARLPSVTTEGDLLLAEARSGAPFLRVPAVASDRNRHLAVSPDGTRIALLGEDGGLELRRLDDGTVLGGTHGPELARATGLAWTGDSSAVLTAGTDQVLRSWSPAPVPGGPLLPGPVRPLPGPAASAFASSPDGTRAATAAADGKIRISDLVTGNAVTEFPGTRSRQDLAHAAQREWTLAAQSLEQAHQNAVIARIEAQEKALAELLKKAQDAIAANRKLLPEKEAALAPARAATAAARQARDAAPAPQRPAAEEKLQTALAAEEAALAAFTATGKNIADAEAEVARIAETRERNAAALAAAREALAAATRAREAATASPASPPPSPGEVPVALAFSADGLRLAARSASGTLRVWSVHNGAILDESASDLPEPVALAASADGRFLAWSILDSRPALAFGDTPRWILERVLGGAEDPGRFADRVQALAFSPDGSRLAIGGGELSRSGDIHLVSVADGSVLRAWPGRHRDSVLSLAFSPDGTRLASGAADYLARVADAESGADLALFEGHTHHVTGVAFRADGRVLATAGADGVVITWDLLQGERKKKIEGWTKEVTAVQFLGATNHILTSAGDNLVRVVTDDGGQIRSLANLPDFMQCAAAAPLGSSIVAGGEDSVLRVWDRASGAELLTFPPPAG